MSEDTKTGLSLMLALVLMAAVSFVGGYASGWARYHYTEPEGTIRVTLGEYIPGETPCLEDEIFDHVRQKCIKWEWISEVE